MNELTSDEKLKIQTNLEYIGFLRNTQVKHVFNL